MIDAFLSLTANPLFGVAISVIAYALALWINLKLRSPIANPLLVSGGMLILLLWLFKIPVENYQEGGSIITMLLAPATAALAIAVYRQIQVLKKHFLPVMLGCTAGTITSMGSAWLLCTLFGLDDSLLFSMLPKSVTTPIAMEISRQGGGVVAITVAAVVVTGILGAICAPLLIRVFHVEDPVAQGVAIGSCSHAMGTSRAIELGEIQGAMSGIAIGVSGMATVLLAMFF